MHNRYLRFVPVTEHRALAANPAAAALASASFTHLPEPDPPLTKRDSAIFLMQIAAEIEHALLVQYLYAAFSLNRTAPGAPDRRSGTSCNKDYPAPRLAAALDLRGYLTPSRIFRPGQDTLCDQSHHSKTFFF